MNSVTSYRVHGPEISAIIADYAFKEAFIMRMLSRRAFNAAVPKRKPSISSVPQVNQNCGFNISIEIFIAANSRLTDPDFIPATGDRVTKFVEPITMRRPSLTNHTRANVNQWAH